MARHNFFKIGNRKRCQIKVGNDRSPPLPRIQLKSRTAAGSKKKFVAVRRKLRVQTGRPEGLAELL